MSIEIAHGVDIHYRDKVSYVFFADGSCIEYPLGSILFELISDEAFYLVTEKLENMIKCYPGFQDALSVESITDGFRWLYGTIQDEDHPVASELCLCNFSEKITETLQDENLSFSCIGDFMLHCYAEYMKDIMEFALYVDVIASENNGLNDVFNHDLYSDFIEAENHLFSKYRKKNRKKKRINHEDLDVFNFKTFLGILFYCHWKLVQENKVFKICQNCGRYFIPKYRRDTKYCFMPDPDRPDKTCSDWASDKIKIDKRKSDQDTGEYHNEYSLLCMAIKRAKEKGNMKEVNDLKEKRDALAKYFTKRNIARNRD